MQRKVFGNPSEKVGIKLWYFLVFNSSNHFKIYYKILTSKATGSIFLPNILSEVLCSAISVLWMDSWLTLQKVEAFIFTVITHFVLLLNSFLVFCVIMIPASQPSRIFINNCTYIYLVFGFSVFQKRSRSKR